MSSKGKKKAIRISEKVKVMAQQIAYENASYNTLTYCLEHQVLCHVLYAEESWTQMRTYHVLKATREYAYVLRADDYHYSGYEIIRLSMISYISPAPELTDHYHMSNLELPSDIPELDIDDLPGTMQKIARMDTLVAVGHIGEDESSSFIVCGHLEKLGKKKIALRELDVNQLAWNPKPRKYTYDDLDFILFRTPNLKAMEQLAMSYEAYIRSINESISVPNEIEDFEVGTDLLEGPSEDFVDIDELTDAEENIAHEMLSDAPED